MKAELSQSSNVGKRAMTFDQDRRVVTLPAVTRWQRSLELELGLF